MKNEPLRVQQFSSSGNRLVSISTPCAPLTDLYSHASSTIIMSIDVAKNLCDRLAEAIMLAESAMESDECESARDGEGQP